MTSKIMRDTARTLSASTLAFALVACGGDSSGTSSSSTVPSILVVPPKPVVSVTQTTVALIKSPWAMTFLPDGRILVTERIFDSYLPGALYVVTQAGVVSAPLAGLPNNYGVLDIKLSPFYTSDHSIYFTFLEPANPNDPRVGRGASDPTLMPAGTSLARAQLSFDSQGNASLSNVQTIWQQTPKIVANLGSGEPGGRIAFSPDHNYMFVTTGDRQELDATEVMSLSNTLGKVIRLKLDGSVPSDNPFVNTAGAKPEIWSLGHRNPYGLAFDSAGVLWENENGPAGGDELNLIQPSANYGWPSVSYGDNYDGGLIPKPMPGDGFAPAAEWWTPAIAPSDMIFYSGSVFGAWNGDAIISGLVSQALIRVHTTGNTIATGTGTEVQRIAMGYRVRAVQQAPDGSIWVLQDGQPGAQTDGSILVAQPDGSIMAKLVKLAPVF